MTALASSTVSGIPSDDALPRMAGRVLTLAGAVFGASNLFQWAVLSGVLPVHPAVLGLVWPVAVTGFIIMLRRLRRQGGEAGRRAAGWSRIAIFTMLGIAAVLLTVSGLTGRWELMAWMSPIALGIYVIAWAVVAVRTRRPLPALLSLIAFAGAAGVVSLIGTPEQYLAYAAALLLVALTPGLWLARGGRL